MFFWPVLAGCVRVSPIIFGLIGDLLVGDEGSASESSPSNNSFISLFFGVKIFGLGEPNTDCWYRFNPGVIVIGLGIPISCFTLGSDCRRGRRIVTFVEVINFSGFSNGIPFSSNMMF